MSSTPSPDRTASAISGNSAGSNRARSVVEPGAAFDGFRRQLDAFGSLEMVSEELIAEGDRVVARLTVRGVHTGAHPRMPEPTLRAFEVEQIWVFTLDHGRIAEIRAVSDRLGMFTQLGWDWPEAGALGSHTKLTPARLSSGSSTICHSGTA
ncbi:ester cyclase [Streptomyces syringium]|uniref:ester cyclase n=1 Tax=Streptomyces syringium TaxID=76729 RepID=UPI003F56666F